MKSSKFYITSIIICNLDIKELIKLWRQFYYITIEKESTKMLKNISVNVVDARKDRETCKASLWLTNTPKNFNHKVALDIVGPFIPDEIEHRNTKLFNEVCRFMPLN